MVELEVERWARDWLGEFGRDFLFGANSRL